MDFRKFVDSAGETQQFAAGEHVFRQGDDNRGLYYLRKGLLKAYYVSDEGKEERRAIVRAFGVIVGP